MCIPGICGRPTRTRPSVPFSAVLRSWQSSRTVCSPKCYPAVISASTARAFRCSDGVAGRYSAGDRLDGHPSPRAPSLSRTTLPGALRPSSRGALGHEISPHPGDIGSCGIYSRIPTGFLPVEDQGYLFAVIQLPDGTSLQRTDAVAGKVREILARRFPSRLRYVP
jgi:hypothetical protein